MAQYGIGLSALNAFSEAIDVTSNNIANGQTVGYKQAEYVFADQFFKAQNPQSRDRAGMGTSRMIIRRANTYGTISGTQNPLDLAIAGPGMFMLAKQVDGTVPTENPQKFQYTRNGQFAVDAENRIVNENGMFLVGYAADSSGNVLDSSKSVLKLDTTAMAQQATKTSTINLNIDSRANPTSGGAFDAKSPASYSQSISQTVYDDKGASHTLSMFYKKVNSLDLVLTQQAGANTFTFEPKQAIGTSLNGEQASTIATTSSPAQVTGPIQTIYNSTLTYVSGGIENISGVKSVDVTAVGSGYTPGIYKNVPITASNGSATSAGSGALATVVIAADGTLGSIKITDAGSGYVSGNNLSISANNIGGTGSGITLTSISALNIVGGTDGATVGTITQGVSPALTITNAGTGYLGKKPSLGLGIPTGTISVSNGGTGYENATYTNVPLTGGSGSGALATVVVSGNTVSSVTITNSGRGYVDGESLTLPNTNIGGSGSGATLAAISIGGSGYIPGTYINVPLSSGSGVGAKATVVVGTNGKVTSVTTTDVGNGAYVPGDVLTLANANIGNSGSGVVIGALSSGTPALAVAAGGTTTYTNVELGKTSGSGTGVIATTTTNGVTATTETGTFTFVGTSGNNTQFKLNGLTLTTTAANTLTAAQVAALWANRGASASVNVSGTGYSITGTTSANFTTAAVTNTNQVVYTAVSAGTKTNFDSDLAYTNPSAASVTVEPIENGDGASNHEEQTATFPATTGSAKAITFNGLTLITTSENTLTAAQVAALWANRAASVSVNESGTGYALIGTTGANIVSDPVTNTNEVVLKWEDSGFADQPLLASTTPSMTTSGMTANGPTIEGIAPQNEVQSVTFAATAGIATSITLNGLTLTTDSTNTLNNQQVAALFAGRADGTPVDETGTGYSLSGTTGNWSTAGVTASGGVLSFTYNTTGNQELIARAAKATVVVSGGTVSSVKITDIGTGYGVGDVLTLAPTDIGGSGSDVSIAALTGSLNAGITEAAPVTFRALTAGESITIGGLTLTASGAINASEVANGFANLSNGSTGNITTNGLWSGTLSGWRTSGVSGSGVTFISAVANNNAEDIKVVTNKVGTGALGSTYNLKLTDGTNLSLKQTTTKGETAQYKVEVDRFAMFATLDGVPVGQTSTGLGTSTIRLGATTTQEQTSLGTVAFVGGKNIDSLSRDQFGRPQFNTKVTIDASGGPGSTWGRTANGGVVQFVLDSTDLTGYSSAAQTYANEQDGTPTSQLTSYSFDTYGKLVAQYDNGKSVVKGQLILASFNNFEGLIPVGGNGFHASAASGDPLIDKPNGSQMGAIRSQSVEESNVDLTQSLVKLMVLQRAYSAASQATKVQVATLVDDTLRIGQ